MSNIDELYEKTVVADNAEEIANEMPQTETEDSEYIPQFDEVSYEEEPTEQEVKTKKKFPLQKTVIITACLVLGALIAYLALALMIPSVEGTWVHKFEEGDQVFEVYYTIDKTKGDYTLDISFYTSHYPGTCDVTKTDSGVLLTVIPKAGQLYPNAPYGEYTYKITGNKLFKKAVLELIDESGNVITLTQGKAPQLTDYIKPFEDFKANEKLTGEWMIDFSMYGMEPVVLTFNEDGTMSIDNRGMQIDYYYYSPQEKTIKVATYAGERVEDEVEYQFEGENLVFLGNLWTRVSEASADQTK